jgi:hypothetical protein
MSSPGMQPPAPPPRPPSWAQRLLRSALGWGLTAALVIAGLALTADSIRLLLSGVGAVNALGAGLTGAALGVLIGILAGVGVATLEALALTAAGGRRWLAPLWPLLGAVPVGLGAWVIMDVNQAEHGSTRLALVLVVAGLGALLTWAAHRPERSLARIAALSLVAVALLIHVYASGWHYREIHDLLELITVLGLVALATPVRRALASAAPARLRRLGLGSLVGALGLLLVVEALVPGWRPTGGNGGLYGPALTRAVRWFADLDGDGFSALAWGGDCDDLDSDRNPFAQDRPGDGDANCNGTDPPAAPRPEDLGLTPARGEPQLGRPARLVLLLSIDALRNDAFRPRLMPQLTALAGQGLWLQRTYAAGTRTVVSLPITQRGWMGGVPVAQRAAAAGVRTALVFGVNGPPVLAQVEPGFDKVLSPTTKRWDARAVTDHVLAELEACPPDQRLYLLAHYYDAHAPYPARAIEDLPLPPGREPSYRNYAAGLGDVDREIGRVFARLRERGWLDQAVVLVASDHGEGFGEHRVIYHSVSAYEELVRVPAVLWAPGLAAGTTDLLTSHSDIYPTLLGALGLLQPEDERFGRSWLRLGADRGAPLHEFVVVRTAHAARGGEVISPMIALVTRRHKLVQVLEENLLDLHDLQADPGERHNISWRQPALRRELQRKLAIYRDVDGFPNAFERHDLRHYKGNFVAGTGAGP